MPHYIIMGVSGCGKSTIGRALAQRLDRPFIEGDDYHPPCNVDKMRAGKPLSNDDRKAWITGLCTAINESPTSVTACSALNETVRGWLRDSLKTAPVFIYLDGSEGLIKQRLSTRTDHYFDPALLDSQFKALHVPKDAVSITIDNSPEAIVKDILRALDKAH